jgi:hypothetical protein
MQVKYAFICCLHKYTKTTYMSDLVRIIQLDGKKQKQPETKGYLKND